ncbi:MAG: MBL fold metallo-hydrolase [Candidatus Atribacteria bacterium]|nr:MBL fold metallo-hydrolase [Candidatus Atribacteria bacterium]
MKRNLPRGNGIRLLVGLIVGGLTFGIFLGSCTSSNNPTSGPTEKLEAFTPGEPLAADQMRISFMGTSFLPRIAQQCNSVFVELGNGDSFVFDFGSGVSSKYVAMGISPSRMDKVFLTHLHGDHVSDLITLYCFGPSQDRKSPLYLYGPSADNPEEGTIAFADNLKKLMKWHEEAFSFVTTGLKNGGDGYDIVAKELPYMTVGGIAYEANGVKITHFPAVHDRNGSISYKLEWNGLSMVFSGDTRPNNYMVEQAKGVDVLIHEMVVPPEVWASKNSGLKPGDKGWKQAVSFATAVQNNSHTPQKALGYIFSQTNPRLAVATHFQVNDDTTGPALNDIRSWYKGPVVIATDLLVINVSKSEIRQRMAVVSDFAWYPHPKVYPPDQLAPPKYDGPYAQLNDTLLGNVIPENVYMTTP